MKQKLMIVMCLFAWTLMQFPVVVQADVVDSSEAADELAAAIVNGQRPPLSAAELQAMSSDDKQQLAIALGQCRQAFQDQETDSGSRQTPQNKTDGIGQQTISEQNLPVLDKEKQHFIAFFGPLARKFGQRYDLYPSVMIAQAILESSWGQSALYRKYHNPMGVKGGGVCMPTLEQAGKQMCAVCANFQVYNGIEAALDNYGKIMQAPLYRRCHRSQSQNYQEATRHLKGTYATDANYDQKLNLLIKHYHLDHFDQEKAMATKQVHVDHLQPQVQVASKVNKTATPAKQTVEWQWPIAGGAGSLGILGLLRRLMK